MLKVIHKHKKVCAMSESLPAPAQRIRSAAARELARSPRGDGRERRASSRSWQRFTLSVLAFSCVGTLTALGLSSSAYAETGSLNLSANVAEAGLELTLSSDSAVLNLAPPYSGSSSASTSVAVEVKTRNGYQLFMSSTGTGALVESNDSTKTIPGLDSSSCNNSGDNTGCSISDDNAFPVNRWGFNASLTSSGSGSGSGSTNNNYIGLPVASAYNIGSSEIGAGSSGTEGYIGNYTVNFGAKVDYTQAPGVYSNTINFIAVSNPSKVYMQDMDALQCTNSPMTVFDIRDESSYKVQRLADGNCWMLDNLALDLSNSATKASINESNTNADATAIAALFNGAGSVSGLDNTSGKYASSGVVNNPNATATADLWSSSTDNWTVPRTNTSKKTSTGAANPSWRPTGEDANKYGGYLPGVYYNYCAASAGTYCYPESGTNVPSDDDSGNRSIDADICPAGWSLPTGGGNGEFRALYNAISAATDNGDGTNGNTAANGVSGLAFRTTLSTPLSGHVDNGSGAVVNVGTSGRWWSSTRGSINTMYRLYMDASNVNPASNNNRSYGFSIRCMMQKDIKDVTYLQDLTDDIATTMEEGKSYELADSRDGKLYHVAKLKDGNVWMLDNLALDPTNETTKANITESTTNADANTIAIFKQGFATAAIDGLNNDNGKYATSGVSNEWGKTIGQDSGCPADQTTAGCTDNWTVPRIKTEGRNTNTTDYINIDYNMNSTAPVTYGDAGNKIGVWYNYCAASMGSYCYPLDGTNNPNSTNNGTRDIEADICPTGWSLPTGGGNRTETSTSEFTQLYRAYGPSLDINNNANNLALKIALSTSLSGGVDYSSGAVVGVGAGGRWWSSTRSNTNYMYTLYVDVSNVGPAHDSTRSYGFSIRCVLR